MDLRIPLAAVLVTGGLIGLATLPFAPEDGALSSPTSESESAADDSLAMLDAAETSDIWAEEVTIDREGDGHFYADVTVDGVPSRMLVDTGASVIALTGEDALAMGLSWNPDAVAPVAQGASGPVYGVHTRLAHVSVGNFEARDVEAMIIPDGLGISLLGQSFLSTVRQVQIEGDRMVLES